MFRLTICVCFLATSLSVSAYQDTTKKEEEILNLSLEDLLKLKVATATKKEQALSETPAIISVITSQDIKQWNYRSVGEALSDVPGLYSINDYVSENLGVRGVNGGQRAYSKVIKLMINGVAIPFRADSTNYLGPELINMDSISRIEVIRGPGSALYGENAFLGVVNIITAESQREIEYGLAASLGNYDRRGVSTRISGKRNNWSYHVSAAYEVAEYDGLKLSERAPASVFIDDKIAKETEQRPTTLFAQIKSQANSVSHEFTTHYFLVDSVAEFLDFGTLTHKNRVSIENLTTAYKLDWQLSDADEINLMVTNAKGSPSDKERLNLGSDLNYPVREFESNVTEFSAEYHASSSDNYDYIIGVDISRDKESLIQIFNVNESSGSSTRLTVPQADVTLKNYGAYFQYLKPIDATSSFTLNLRHDTHNIYGSNTNYRIGYVKKHTPTVSVKYLLGTSYKAPAAMQLYAQPLYPGEIVGNSELLAEEAITLETEVSWVQSKSFTANLSLWVNEIENKVELLPIGPNVQPQNTGQQSGYGLESELRWLYERHSVSANVAYQSTETESERPFQPALQVPTSMYPKLTGVVKYRFQITPEENIGFSLRYASERRATDSSIRENFFVPYQLPEYTLLNASYTKSIDNWSLGIRFNNILNKEYNEPGFLGVDIPSRQQEWTAKISYEF